MEVVISGNRNGRRRIVTRLDCDDSHDKAFLQLAGTLIGLSSISIASCKPN